MTPRFNPEVNSYWMCDIGRFQYHWVESDRRLRQPLLRRAAAGAGGSGLQAVPWADALVAVNEAVVTAGGPDRARFLVSAHASLEELYILKQIAAGTGGITLGWRQSEKPQPPNTKFRIPTIDAPNVRGARDLGFAVDATGPNGADLSELRTAIGGGKVPVLYVFDPGPDGSLGDTDWIVAARQAGKITTLIVQGVLQTPLAAAADIVLAGSAFVEKDATYTNMTGLVQATSRVIPPPADAGEDGQILMKLSVVFGAAVSYASAAAVRDAIARDLAGVPGYAALSSVAFSRPVSARHWLQTSNPSERWKWDHMFQDLPPVKFGDDFGPIPRAETEADQASESRHEDVKEVK
jgi:NADH-quinone oxidoreductase subunit G